MFLHVVGEGAGAEDELGPAAFGQALEPRDGIKPFGPCFRSPGLNDALAGHELDVAPGDVPAERGERRSFGRVAGRRCAGELGEFLRVDERAVNLRGRSGKGDFLVDGRHGRAPLARCNRLTDWYNDRRRMSRRARTARKDANLDGVFFALADPTRRRILGRLARGPASIGELAEPFSMTLPAVSKHVRILERAALVRRER